MNNRFDISCTHFQSCPGCVYPSISKPPEIFLQAQGFFQKIKKGFILPLIQGAPTGWRSRAKLVVRASSNPRAPHIGLFQEGSHEVVEIPLCQVHHPQINEAVKRFQTALQEPLAAPLSFYDEKSGKGDLRYIQCIVERRSGKVSLSFVLNFSINDAMKLQVWKTFCKRLIEQDESYFWHSLWLNFNPLKTNAIFGNEWLKIAGQESLWEQIMGLEIPFGPSHFGQANLDLFERLVQEIGHHVEEESRVVEFYAGMGVIGLTLAKKCASVTISEREMSAEHFFLIAKERLAYITQQKLHFVTGAAENEAKLFEGADICIVDPPRKGLDPAFLQKLCTASSIKKLIYVSCNFASFERDCTQILSTSTFQLLDAKSYLFFPGTNHIETLAIFIKEP